MTVKKGYFGQGQNPRHQRSSLLGAPQPSDPYIISNHSKAFSVDIVFIRNTNNLNKKPDNRTGIQNNSRLDYSKSVNIFNEMTALAAKVIALGRLGDHHQVIIHLMSKYRGSFDTLAFGEIKPYSGSLKNGRLDLVYYRDPGLKVGDNFPVWTLS